MNLTIEEHYELLKSQGLSGVAVAVALCRLYPDIIGLDRIDMVLRCLSTKVPEQAVLREHWLKQREAEGAEHRTCVGCVDDGCYFYCSYLHRPGHTVFIKWEKLDAILAQDGFHLRSLHLYSFGDCGGRDIPANSDMPGFLTLVQTVSSRFFGKHDYIESKFKKGGHPPRRFRLWSKEQGVEPDSASGDSGDTTMPNPGGFA